MALFRGTQTDRRTDEATLLKLTKSKMRPISKELAAKVAKVRSLDYA